MVSPIVTLALLASVSLALGQSATDPYVQNTSWNSTFKLSQDQITSANLTAESASLIDQIANFDRTLMANGGPHQDDFYTLPAGMKAPTEGGKLIKLQEVTDPSNFTLPAFTSMSRFIYSTTNFNGMVVPASAYVLWPYQPKKIPGSNGKVPTILWTHGTAGWFASAAPSAHRSLFYADIMPYTLALAGYAVVAPDYAGLGVGKSWDGSEVPHQYSLYSVGAGDALNALRAALEAFPGRLTSKYVNVGHSQGGVISLGIAEALAENGTFADLVGGHLGSIVFGMQPSAFKLAVELILPWVGKYLNGIFPAFNIRDWLTPLGIDRLDILKEVEGGQFISSVLFEPKSDMVQSDWNETWAVSEFSKISTPGNKPWKSPLLMIQGTMDPAVAYEDVEMVFNSTCKKYPGDMQLIKLPGVGHFSALHATKPVWMNWIDERFHGVGVEKHGCVRSTMESYLPLQDYQHQINNFPQWAGLPEWFYELPQNA